MVAITATNSTTQSLQTSLTMVRLEQAKREADTAEAKAEDLRAQADNAEREAQDRKDNVRELSAAKPTDTPPSNTYSAPAKSSFVAVPTATQDFLVRMYKATSPQFAASGNPLKDDSKAAPAINTLGQATGRIVNLSI
jgi:hypothetical protein